MCGEREEPYQPKLRYPVGVPYVKKLDVRNVLSATYELSGFGTMPTVVPWNIKLWAVERVALASRQRNLRDSMSKKRQLAHAFQQTFAKEN